MQSISRDDLNRMNQWDKDDFVLINVLPREAFQERHIRTSINVPQTDTYFTDTVEHVVGDKGRKVVVYCASFECDASEKAAQKLDEAGFKQVFDYEGGVRDWFSQ